MEKLAGKFPLIRNMQKGEEVFWRNTASGGGLSPAVTGEDIAEAAERLSRFAPYFARVFPETRRCPAGAGIIESPLQEINGMRSLLSEEAGVDIKGRLLLKRDSDLPISGSIKARGGIYEVLCFAEEMALANGLSPKDDYGVLAEESYKRLFSGYSLAVGSTGNLGLSIGIMGATLGFNVTVHMSVEAKEWKKDLLREKGAAVVTHTGDYEKAVAVGRAEAQKDPKCHFVDDEKSKTLFLGYTAAGARVKRQLEEMDIPVDKDHPLYVYLPCGVGGGPGGVAYGLKQIYGENVRCFFAEPVEAPCMLLGLMTGLGAEICAQDVGLSGKTIADGLAVSRASALVAELVGGLLDGLYTVSDANMEKYVRQLYSSEGIFIEPSATPGFSGCLHAERLYGGMETATHIVWATGGSMAPESERKKLLEGK